MNEVIPITKNREVRIDRIRDSLKKISKLMAQLKQLAKEKEHEHTN